MPLHGFPRARVAGTLRTALLAAAIVLLLGLVGSLAPVEAAPAHQSGGPGEALFQAKCVACHTIGKGKLVGPDLKDVTTQRDPAWLKSFIADPNKLFAANDPIAQQLLSESNGVKMPALGLTAEEVNALVVFLGGGTAAGGTTAATGAGAAPQPAAAGDPAAGQRIFAGEARLSSGGPACIGCHAVSGMGLLGGGALGPDLTHVSQRYPGPGLTAVLGNIAFPTMVGPFTNRPLTPQELADLDAFFAQTDKTQPAVATIAAGALTESAKRLFIVGLAGAVALLVLMVIFWPRQRQSASARLRALAKHD